MTDIEKSQKYYDFKAHHVYKISSIIGNRQLRNKTVVFCGFSKVPHDITRAVVKLLNPDGSSGEEWQIDPSLIIRI
jgi:hypothetical protein